jgi:hypothetical protein
MTYIHHALVVLQYTCQSVAIFSGGLFAGAAIYISLTECPPRTALTPDGLLALYRSISKRTNGILALLAALTAVTALIAAFAGGGVVWLAGGATHAVILAFLLTNAKHTATELENLDVRTDAAGESKRLLRQRAVQFVALSLAGLFAQYLFVMGR